MTRAALYARVSTVDQHHESQLLDLQQLAAHRGWEIVDTYIDHGVSGTRTRRPALDRLMADAARHRFDVVAVAAFDRMARSVRHLLETLRRVQPPGGGVHLGSRKHRQRRRTRTRSLRDRRCRRPTGTRSHSRAGTERDAAGEARGSSPGPPPPRTRSPCDPPRSWPRVELGRLGQDLWRFTDHHSASPGRCAKRGVAGRLTNT